MSSSEGALATRYFRFNRNVVVSVLVRVATLFSGLIAASVLARGLGVTLYGLWALATTFMSYLALIDLGVSGGLIKLAGEAGARDDRGAVSNYTALAATFYSVVGLVLIGVVFLLKGVLVRLLGVPPDLRPAAGLLFTTATLLLMLNNLVAVYQGTVTSAEAIHLTSVVSLVTAAGNLAAALLLEGWFKLGPQAVLWGMVAAAAATIVISMALYGVICKPVHWFPRRVRLRELGSMVSFSSGVQLSNIASIVNSSLDKFVLSAFVGLSATAIYDLGSRPSLLTSSICWLIATAAYPALVKVAGSKQQFQHFFSRFETYLQIVCCGLAGLLIAVARPFVGLWLGTPYDRVIPVLEVMALARCGLALTNVATVAHWARGMTRDTIIFAVARLALHLACSLLLVWRWGLPGALVGGLISFIVPSVWFVGRTGKVLGVPVRPWMMRLGRIVVASAVATILAVLTAAAADRIPLPSVLRWLVEGTLGATIFVAAYLTLLYVMKVVTRDGIRSMVQVLRSGRGADNLA